MLDETSIFKNDLLEQFPQLLTGLFQTLQLTAVISVTGLVLGIVVFYLAISKQPFIRRLTEGYISFFIGTPLIVLLFIMYYGLPELGVQLAPFSVAVIGFTLNVAAYNAAYLTSAYNGLDFTELEAAKAQGFSYFQTYRLITLPQVLSTSVPALTNQVINNLKDSSLAFLIQYTEFFARIQELASTNFEFFKAYIFAGLVYLALVSLIVIVARVLEKKLLIP